MTRPSKMTWPSENMLARTPHAYGSKMCLHLVGVRQSVHARRRQPFLEWAASRPAGLCAHLSWLESGHLVQNDAIQHPDNPALNGTAQVGQTRSAFLNTGG